mgnify:CR=1 FL=1
MSVFSQARLLIAEILKDQLPTHWYVMKFKDDGNGSGISELLGLSLGGAFQVVMDQAGFRKQYGHYTIFLHKDFESFLAEDADLQGIECAQVKGQGKVYRIGVPVPSVLSARSFSEQNRLKIEPPAAQQESEHIVKPKLRSEHR